MMLVRRATREDIAAFSDLRDTPTVKAWAGEIDGRIVALGGLMLSNGRWTGFSDLTEPARGYKMTIARTALRILAEARQAGIRFIYATADPNEPGSVRWLTRLGFAIDPRTLQYRWKA